MHIPDNYLSVSTCAVLALATVPVWRRSIRKVARDFPRERFSALGVAAAFSFLAMMFNVPLPGGTTGHAVGGTALAVLLGPEAACVALTIALAIQALLFGDGGILAFGANCFNLAFVLPFAGFAIWRLLGKIVKNDAVRVGIASYVGLNVAALTTAVEFGIQPLLFVDAAGRALYCPYPLSVAIPAMALGHLTVFGLAEVVFSVAVFSFVRRAVPSFSPIFAESPDQTASTDAFDASSTVQIVPATSETPLASAPADDAAPKPPKLAPLYWALAVLVVATPLGLLAEGTAWGEWGADEIAETASHDGTPLGYAPAGMTNGFEWSALVPDYAAPGLPDWAAYVLSALVGVALSIVVVKLAAAFLCSEPNNA